MIASSSPIVDCSLSGDELQEAEEISGNIIVSKKLKSLENSGSAKIQTTLKKQCNKWARTSSIWDHLTTKVLNKVQCKHSMNELSGNTSYLKYHLKYHTLVVKESLNRRPSNNCKSSPLRYRG